eukprot:7114542-Alexandrium_andersonii.AAC.1
MPVPATKVASGVKVQTAYAKNVYSNLRMRGYFVDFELMDFDIQKDFFRFSLGGGKSKKYFPSLEPREKEPHGNIG